MKKQPFFPFFLFVLTLALFATSCSKDEADDDLPTPSNPTNPTNPGDDCDTDNVTFSGTIKGILSGTCTGCHSGDSPRGDIDLAEYEGVKKVADNGKLLGALKHESGFAPMPQGGGQISDCKIAQVEQWIANGAADD